MSTTTNNSNNTTEKKENNMNSINAIILWGDKNGRCTCNMEIGVPGAVAQLQAEFVQGQFSRIREFRVTGLAMEAILLELNTMELNAEDIREYGQKKALKSTIITRDNTVYRVWFFENSDGTRRPCERGTTSSGKAFYRSAVQVLNGNLMRQVKEKLISSEFVLVERKKKEEVVEDLADAI
jgi:hypothetical protein